MRVVRQLGVILGASLFLAALGAPAAKAGVTCAEFPSWCSPNQSSVHNLPPTRGDHSTPEPGTLGLLALGAAVAFARMGSRKKK